MRLRHVFLGIGLLVPTVLLLLYWQVYSGRPTRLRAWLARSLEPADNVGDIAFDPATDRADFTLCHPSTSVQYYQSQTTYPGGTQALRRIFLRETPLPRGAAAHNGYVTIRFLINCHGETDRFRVLQIDTAYQPTQFAAPLVRALLSRTKALRGWQPGTYAQPGYFQGKPLDSYYYLLFRIADGQVVDVLP